MTQLHFHYCCRSNPKNACEPAQPTIQYSSFSPQVKFGKAKSYFLGHRFMVTYGRDPGTGQAFKI